MARQRIEKVGKGHQLGWILWESKLKEIEVLGKFASEPGRKMRVKSKREVIRADGVEIT